MYFRRPEGNYHTYVTLEELVKDLTDHPNEVFVRWDLCEGVVYDSEVDVIFFVSSMGFLGSEELKREELTRRWKAVKAEGQP